MPSSSMYWTMTPISSMCPSSMIVGLPFGFTSAMLLPATSDVTTSANVLASSRQTRAAGPSKPDGPGVSSRRLRNASEDVESKGLGTGDQGLAGGLATDGKHPEGNGEDPDPGDKRTVVPCQPVVQDAIPGDHLSEKD